MYEGKRVKKLVIIVLIFCWISGLFKRIVYVRVIHVLIYVLRILGTILDSYKKRQ